MPARRLLSCNDTSDGSRPDKIWLIDKVPGDIQGATLQRLTDRTQMIAEEAGVITDVNLFVSNTGTDASNDLSLSLTVKKNGTTVCSTDAAITKAASDNASTRSAGTGKTVAVLKTDDTPIFAAGDRISLDYTLTRTDTPSDEMADAVAMIGVVFFAS